VPLGAMMFGVWGKSPDHDDSVRIIRRALEGGINFIDTADVYSAGESEKIVGKALAEGKLRRDVVLAHQGARTDGERPQRTREISRRWITAEVENSLRRLGTDYIDLYQITLPDPTCDVEETLSALTDLVRAGKDPLLRLVDVSPRTRSSRRSGSPSGATSVASCVNNRRTRSSPAGSSAMCCRSPRSTGWV